MILFRLRGLIIKKNYKKYKYDDKRDFVANYDERSGIELSRGGILIEDAGVTVKITALITHWLPVFTL